MSCTQKVKITQDYHIKLENSIFSSDKQLISQALKNRNTAIFIDKGIGLAAVEEVHAYFNSNNLSAQLKGIFLLEGGEYLKNNLQEPLKIVDMLDSSGLDRKSVVIIIGGGALLDMVGFACSMYHRGIAQIRIPTTLLSQIDAGIGTKNGINHLGQKNTLGFFFPPEQVIVDPDFLLTLDSRAIRSGLAECIKIALIKDLALFQSLEANYNLFLDYKVDNNSLKKIMWSVIEGHLEQISLDPYEDKIARPLDYGHEWGHRLEIVSQHELNHGEAISIGMALDSHLSLQKGFITEDDYQRIIALFQAVGLPIYHKLVEVDLIWPGLEDFRRHLGGELTITLLNKLGGKQDVYQIDKQEIELAIKDIKIQSEV